MKIDRLLFLGLTATLTAGSAACASGTTPSVFDDAHTTGSARAPAEAPASPAGGTATASVDSKASTVLGAYRPVAKSGVPASDGPADPGGEPGPDASDGGVGDGGVGDGGVGDGGVGDGGVGDAGDPGPIDEVCAPFTSELSELACRASYQTGVKPAVRAALLACASAADVPSCALGALALGSTGSFATDPLCAPLSACETAPWVSAFQCSLALAGLEPDGVALVQGGGLDTSCDATMQSFVRQLLIDVQP